MSAPIRPMPRVRAYLKGMRDRGFLNRPALRMIEGFTQWTWLIVLIAMFYWTDFSVVQKAGVAFGSHWLVNGLLSLIATRVRAADARRDAYRAEATRLMEELSEFADNRSLEERFHPRVAELLEQCAEAHAAVLRVTQGGKPGARSGDSWKGIRDSALTEAEVAMEHALVLVRGSFRARGMRRKTWADYVEANPDGGAAAVELESIRDGLNRLHLALGDALGDEGVRSALQQLQELQEAEKELGELPQSLRSDS